MPGIPCRTYIGGQLVSAACEAHTDAQQPTCSWPAAHPAAVQGVVEARDVDQPHCQADAGDDLARSSRPPHQGPEADCSRRHGKHKTLCRRDESCRRKAGTAKLIQDNRRAWGSACAWATPGHCQGHAPWTGTGQSPPASASAASAPPPSRPSRPCTVRLGGELTLPYPTLPMSRAHRGRMQGLRCKGRQPGDTRTKEAPALRRHQSWQPGMGSIVASAACTMSAVAGAPDLPDRGVCPRAHHHGPRLASSDDRPLLRHTRRGVLPASRVSRVPHAVSVLTRGQAVLACKAAMRYKHHALQHRRHQAPQDDALACMCKHSTPACANTPDQHVQTLQPACRTQEAAGRAEKSRQVLSWYTAFCAVTTSVNLATLPLSPVRMDCARPSKRSWVF